MELGKKQKLIYKRKEEFGIYLTEKGNDEERVLLPAKQVPANAKIGDEIEVFLYKDSKDRLIATTNTPLLTLHETAVLTVKEVGKIGAFLDWGLEKDLLLPFAEQTVRVKAGDKALVALYTDKSDRLAATMKVYKYLKQDSSYKKEDHVDGLVYELSDNFGAFVAVDNKYSGLISKKELTTSLKVGDRVKARVISVKEDGKLDLSLREKAPIQISLDADILVKMMKANGGKLDFSDNASPELIKEETGMSKNQFKRAVGNLLKSGKIEILENSIKLK
ncbi:MAG: S1 RNA-binding domain-containing protein [Lachnospiraceae bacterium]|nr:S1 RNA-binding domain-containing protein [Lachnospiraceae bacterium]